MKSLFGNKEVKLKWPDGKKPWDPHVPLDFVTQGQLHFLRQSAPILLAAIPSGLFIGWLLRQFGVSDMIYLPIGLLGGLAFGSAVFIAWRNRSNG
ncbi:hypothetical protein PARPLA_03135 [Rhodobacteraceae bacterium THAF1]|uniref:hypothetical protein n=1 Tax=Palleronia sp. THAF1 TaxID=2587842 RepID=UPI000F3F18E0|nr:hypothetical protein [Palleronia sp. THAF1]QFU08539.1 hypothetical protein FIU81_07630 [Palleronia sp. THAF1]VDC30589.1 hypothetical protein PARPLA_03135 [Rhodobacteraceae bacterium THAF1]